jgi:hypothetical protein
MNEENLKEKAKYIIEDRLEHASRVTYAEMVSMNLNLPPEYQYRSVREIQTIMVKGAFDALGFSVELGLFGKDEAADFWNDLRERYKQLWPEKQA